MLDQVIFNNLPSVFGTAAPVLVSGSRTTVFGTRSTSVSRFGAALTRPLATLPAPTASLVAGALLVLAVTRTAAATSRFTKKKWKYGLCHFLIGIGTYSGVLCLLESPFSLCFPFASSYEQHKVKWAAQMVKKQIELIIAL